MQHVAGGQGSSGEVRERPTGVVRRTVGEQAADYVRGLILDGELAPGERIPQTEVASAFGISRTPLREALVILEREGWISIEAHRGAFVNAFDARTIEDHYRIYGALLGLAGTLAIERGGPELAGVLDRIRADFAAAIDADEQSRLAVRFNRLLLDTAGSPRLRQLIEQMRGLPLVRYYDLVPDAAARQEAGFDEIIRAVRIGDGDAVTDAYARLMADAGTRMMLALSSRGVMAPRPRAQPGDPDR